MKDHSCYENVSSLTIKDRVHNNRVEGEGFCDICGGEVTVEFLADLYHDDSGETHYINS